MRMEEVVSSTEESASRSGSMEEKALCGTEN